jgi:glycosyltransferase involved in cell wall biosynthesis
MTHTKILMTSPHRWTSPFQLGTHHLARAFLRLGWEVGLLVNPISPLHAFSAERADAVARLRIFARGGQRHEGGRLWEYVPAALATPTNRPLLRSEWVCRNWQRLTVPPLEWVLRRNGFDRVDLLYFDSPTELGLLDTVAHERSVLRIADRMDGFSAFPPAMLALEREMARRVDLVIYSARTLQPHVESLGPRRAVCVPNGVDAGHFAAPHPAPPEYAGLARPIAVYVGAMAEWFDFDLLARAAAAMPDVSFVLIGPDGLARQRLPELPNLHILGPRPFARLPGYLQHADVGLIPFDVAGHGKLVHTVNPLKLYEYFACGIPTVAAAWDELRATGSPAHLYERPDDFPAVLRAALAAPRDRDALVAFARRADWSARATALVEHLALPTAPITPRTSA